MASGHVKFLPSCIVAFMPIMPSARTLLPSILADHGQSVLKFSCPGTMDWASHGYWTGYEIGRLQQILVS